MSERRSEKAQSWACPDCAWMHAAHPTYGWSARDDRAIEVHQTTLCPWRTIEPCRLGYEEYDGARYCFEHGGFLEAGVQSRRCDRAMSECTTCSGRGVWMDEPCSDCTTPPAQPDGEASA